MAIPSVVLDLGSLVTVFIVVGIAVLMAPQSLGSLLNSNPLTAGGDMHSPNVVSAENKNKGRGFIFAIWNLIHRSKPSMEK